MSPEDFTVIEKVSGFSGPEVQLRDRGDTFVLEEKKWAIATIEDALANEVTAASTAAPALYYCYSSNCCYTALVLDRRKYKAPS